MSNWINLLTGLAMALNLLALGSSRLPSIIRAAATQGVILGILPLFIEPEFTALGLLVSVGTVGIKGFLIPHLLRRAMRSANIDREEEPLIGFIPSLLVGAAAAIGALGLSSALPLLPKDSQSLLVPAALATIVAGLVLLIGRTKAISQVCGYLLLENGIYIFGLMLIESMPLVVEAGILLDLTVAVFVIGIIVDRIQRAFDTLDTRKLTSLHE